MIKGVSEVRRLPRLGHIRLGEKVPVANKPGITRPKEVDYFILDPKTPDPKWNEDLKKEFLERYGDKPKAIKIMFPPVPPGLFFQQFYKRYGSSTLVKCKGDGEIATTTEEFGKGLEKIGEDDRGFIQVKCLGPECPYQTGKNEFCSGSPECSRIAMLQVILPELPGMGIWQINTGSFNSIVNINSAIEWLAGLCGRFAMIPLTLMRVPQDIPYEGTKTKHYILQVDQNNFSIEDVQKLALRPVERALLPAPDETKDALFFDKDGKKPPELAAEAEVVDEKPEEHQAGPGPQQPPEAPQKREDGGKGFITKGQLEAIKSIQKKYKWADEDLLFKIAERTEIEVKSIVALENLSKEKAELIITKLQK